MYGYFAYMFVCHMHAWCQQRTEEGIGSLGTRFIDDCEAPCVLGIEPGFSGGEVSALNH